MRKLLRCSRIWAGTRKYSQRIAEQITKGIQVMNAHDSERHPALSLLPSHPVGNGTHVDGCKNGFTKRSLVQQTLHGSNRLVVSHVLIDCQDDTCVFAHVNDRFCLRVVDTQRLLCQDAADAASSLCDVANDLKLNVGGNCNVDNLNLSITQQFAIVCVDIRDCVPIGDVTCAFYVASSNRDWIEACLSIGHQMAIRHDEPRSDAAYPDRAVARQSRQIVQLE